MNLSDVVVTSDGRTISVRDCLAENVDRRKKAEARVAELEQELTKINAMLREYMLVGPVDDLAAMKAEFWTITHNRGFQPNNVTVVGLNDKEGDSP